MHNSQDEKTNQNTTENLINIKAPKTNNNNNLDKSTEPLEVELSQSSETNTDNEITNKSQEERIEEKILSITKQIEKLEEENKDLKDRLLRQIAESENLKIRSEKSVKDARLFGIQKFAEDLLDVMDNFERALEYIPENLNQDMKNILMGISMTKDQLAGIFEKNKIISIKPSVGDIFDYNEHAAIMHEKDQNMENNQIKKLMQTGYQINDRLLRAASVVVVKND